MLLDLVQGHRVNNGLNHPGIVRQHQYPVQITLNNIRFDVIKVLTSSLLNVECCSLKKKKKSFGGSRI